ncbi:MAG: hypothetical protein ISR51_03195 [Rhodospirillales bacterium]|nr:hypothetical protein [Alphaproteobacteria bacterium]MBL6947659.1 hypothetical protein [Rhodospirillales bacterium]
MFPSLRPGLGKGLFPVLLAGVLSLGLSACGGYQYVADKFASPVILKCPDYRVVADAAKLIKFRDGPGRDLVDVNYEGEITGVKLGCLSNIDKQTKTGTLDVDVTLDYIASRGPANRDSKARFDYFISVVDPDRKILYREAFPLVVAFPGNQTRIRFSNKPVTLELPILAKRSSRYYRIFVGLTLTRDEVHYNREKLQRARK